MRADNWSWLGKLGERGKRRENGVSESEKGGSKIRGESERGVGSKTHGDNKNWTVQVVFEAIIRRIVRKPTNK